MKILIVDDEPNIVMALEYTFKRTILKFYSTRRPRGFRYLKVQLPDVIILDVMMPMVDGFATEQIKKTNDCGIAKSFLSAKNKERKHIEKDLH
jgi:DNA-binding response OmpR family regulator